MFWDVYVTRAVILIYCCTCNQFDVSFCKASACTWTRMQTNA